MPPPLPIDLVRAEARRIGFIACGVADLAPSARAQSLDQWLGAGYGGTMRYLHRQASRRKEPSAIVPGARRAVVVLENYLPRSPEGPGVKIARYARGADYHRVTLTRLEQLAEFLRGQGARVARCFVDAGPVPERELAQRAGLGWVGKNTMLLRPGVGSYFFIGSIFTDLEFPPDSIFETDHCGSCRACLDACPTDAFPEPRVLDATRCISYLTIEQKGPIPEGMIEDLNGWAFGCDICNEVCPWNEKFAEPTAVESFEPVHGGGPDTLDPSFFDRMDEEEFAARFGHTPLDRPGLAGMRRNWKAAYTSRP